MPVSTTYATVTEFKKRINDRATGSTNDVLYQQLLDTSARIIDAMTRRSPEGTEAFSIVEATRYYDDYGAGVIQIDDLYEIDSLEPTHGVVLGETTLTTIQYTLFPYNERPYTQLRYNDQTPFWYYTTNTRYGFGGNRGYPFPNVGFRQVAITGNWGYCTQGTRPPEVKEATLTQAERLYERFGIKITDIMAAMRDPWKNIDPIVLMMIEPLVKPQEVVVA
jgi:hypothetical protein